MANARHSTRCRAAYKILKIGPKTCQPGTRTANDRPSCFEYCWNALSPDLHRRRHLGVIELATSKGVIGRKLRTADDVESERLDSLCKLTQPTATKKLVLAYLPKLSCLGTLGEKLDPNSIKQDSAARLVVVVCVTGLPILSDQKSAKVCQSRLWQYSEATNPRMLQSADPAFAQARCFVSCSKASSRKLTSCSSSLGGISASSWDASSGLHNATSFSKIRSPCIHAWSSVRHQCPISMKQRSRPWPPQSKHLKRSTSCMADLRKRPAMPYPRFAAQSQHAYLQGGRIIATSQTIPWLQINIPPRRTCRLLRSCPADRWLDAAFLPVG